LLGNHARDLLQSAMIKLIKGRIFRETSNVRFADINIDQSNGLDLVEHFGPSISPPNSSGRKQWYVHKHQDDYNRCIKGHRLFELFYAAWDQPHWFVMLDENSGALYIPAGCLHRSYSGLDGSLVLNQAKRYPGYSEELEFNPVFDFHHDFHAPRYQGCTPKQVGSFIQYGTFD